MTSASNSSSSRSGGSGGSTSTSSSSLGGAIFKRTRPLVSVFQDSAQSYSSRETKYAHSTSSALTKHEGNVVQSHSQPQTRGGGGNKRTPKMFTNIKKSFAGVRRWPSPSPSTATYSDFSNRPLQTGTNTRVLYSTPAERLAARPRASEILPYSSSNSTSTSPPTVAQIAMGLHTSRTPHSRTIRQSSHPHPPGLSKRYTSPPALPTRSALKSSTSNSAKELDGSSRLFSTHSNLSSHTTLSTPNSGSGSSFQRQRFGPLSSKGFFTKSRKVRSPFRQNSVTSSTSNVSRKTVRFDDSASV